VSRQKFPNASRKRDQADAAHGGARGIRARTLTASKHSAHSFLLFTFALMLFNHGRATGENRGKGEKEAAKTGATLFGNNSGDRGDESAKKEAQQVLPPFRPLQTRCTYGNNHGGQLDITYHKPVATHSQRSNMIIVTGNAENLNRNKT